jgi:hypothetical protein
MSGRALMVEFDRLEAKLKELTKAKKDSPDDLSLDYLLEWTLEVKQSYAGVTPLMVAVYAGEAKVVEMLLLDNVDSDEIKSDWEYTTYKGTKVEISLLDMAVASGNHDVVTKVLESKLSSLGRRTLDIATRFQVDERLRAILLALPRPSRKFNLSTVVGSFASFPNRYVRGRTSSGVKA